METLIRYSVFSLLELNHVKAEKLFITVQNIVQPLVDHWLWHNESFNLTLKPFPASFSSDIQQYYLYGETNVGECLEDAWMIVFILQKLTQDYSDLCIKIEEEENHDFLLIECAPFLPNWMQTTAENRSFLHQTQLHLLPPLKDEKLNLDLKSALERLRNEPQIEVKEKIETCWKRKISKFPYDNRLPMKCILPRDCARLLHQKPDLISLFIRTLAHSLPQQKADCKFPADSFILFTAQITKTQFAQLHFHQYQTPADLLRQPDIKEVLSAESVEAEWMKRGVKLTRGIELAMTSSLHQLIETSRDQMTDQEFDSFLEQHDYWNPEQDISSDILELKEDELKEFLNEYSLEKQDQLHKMTSSVHQLLTEEQSGLEGIQLPKNQNKKSRMDLMEEKLKRKLAKLKGEPFAYSSSDSEDSFDDDDKEEEYRDSDSETSSDVSSDVMEQEDEELQQFMTEMDNELSEYAAVRDPVEGDEEEHLIKNLLKSYQSQQASCGPGRVLLQGLGYWLPPDSVDDETNLDNLNIEEEEEDEEEK